MKTSTFVLFALFFVTLQGQNSGLFVELGGSGGLGSLNYESNFKSFEKFDLNFRAGLSFTPVDRNNGTAIGMPLLLNAVWGSGHWKGEAGIGQGLSITTRGKAFVLGLLNGGVRYHPEGKRYYYRMNYTPLVSYLVDFQWQHWGGLSVGFWLN
jgi:hypothetical protein